ncbi:hypothetical protein Tco_0930074 [Tanacetum coccineum]
MFKVGESYTGVLVTAFFKVFKKLREIPMSSTNLAVSKQSVIGHHGQSWKRQKLHGDDPTGRQSGELENGLFGIVAPGMKSMQCWMSRMSGNPAGISSGKISENSVSKGSTSCGTVQKWIFCGFLQAQPAKVLDPKAIGEQDQQISSPSSWGATSGGVAVLRI